MPEFVIDISRSKRRKHLIWGSINIAASVFLVGMLVYYLFYEVDLVRKGLFIAFAINFGGSGYERLKKSKRKEFFLSINGEAITWVMDETEKPMSIGWNDIRWIKQEENEAILVFRESSFSVGFSFAGFRKEEKIQILELIEKYATEKEISLVNFSTPVLATA